MYCQGVSAGLVPKIEIWHHFAQKNHIGGEKECLLKNKILFLEK